MPEQSKNEPELFPEIAEAAKETTPTRERVKKLLRKYISFAEERARRRAEQEKKDRATRLAEAQRKFHDR